MSRQIDLGGELTPDEVQYLRERGQLPAGYSSDEPEAEELEFPREKDNYPDWSNEELRAELDERELSTGGNKTELIARLRENDQEEE